MLADAIKHLTFNQFRRCLGQFYCSQPGCGANPASTYFVNPLFQKNQFAAPAHSCCYFAAVDTSCFYYGFCWFLLLLYKRYSRTRASFLNAFKFNELCFLLLVRRHKKAGALLL